MAHNSGWALLSLIDSILDLSKIEARKITLEDVNFRLSSVLEELAPTLQAQAEAKGLAYSWRVAPETPPCFRGDAHRLRQVLNNLAGNAIKFTENGSIEIAVSLDRQEGPTAAVRFAVTDTGIGIQPDQATHLFSPFVQADASTTRKYGGTGLGLAICKQLVEIMGGAIGVQSVEGRGSTFWFTAVFGVSPPCPQMLPDAAPGLGLKISGQAAAQRQAMRILIAEDSATNRLVALAQLKRIGYQAVAVCNGVEAVEAVQSGGYDLVLMDCQMPVMDGFEATRRIRGSLHPDIPIIALTADAMAGDCERCLSEGMNDYLSKPLALGTCRTC